MKQLRRGFKKWAEDISVNHRTLLGLKPSDYLSAKLLADYLKVKILEPTQIPGISTEILNEVLKKTGSWSAVTIGSESMGFFVIHNSSHSKQRQESNLMHELSHIICKHDMCELDLLNGIPLRKYTPSFENEAEWLGGCLQMPRIALENHLKQLTLDEIQAKFYVSQEMLRFRMNVTGFGKKVNEPSF